MTVETILLPEPAILGEGPAWFADALWLVDIKRHAILRHDPVRGETRTWNAGQQVGWVLPHDGDGLLAGLQSGLARFDPDSGTIAPLHDPEPHLPGNRLNDATTGPDGALWYGTMDDAETASSGRFWRWHRGEHRDSGLAPVCISNGPAVDPQGAWLYHTDTAGRTIARAPIRADGTLGPAEPFVTIAEGEGWPDGPVVDAEGCVWTGVWGGWCVRRYDPAGRLMREVRLPAANVTKIAIGGPDGCTAYATTARKGLDAAALAAQPLAGHVFAFDAGVAGVPVTPVAL